MIKKALIYFSIVFICCNWSYADCISGDCVNGKGTFTSSNGTKFEGKFKNGQMYGIGTLTTSDGRKVVGVIKDGEFK